MSSLSLRVPGTNPLFNVRWRVVIADTHGCHFLYELTLLPSDRRSDVARKLMHLYEDTSWRARWLMRAVPFMLPVVHVVALSPVPIEDLSRRCCRAVDVDTTLSNFNSLTKAMRHTRHLPDPPNFAASHSRFTIVHETPGKVRARDALLIQLELDKFRLLVVIAVATILSVAFGITAGICRRSLDTGFGVFGGMLGVIGVFEGILTSFLT